MDAPSRDRNDRKARLEAYWKENFRLIMILTVIWAVVTFAHPPFAASLNQITILTGFPLGYWLSSQFSITVFVVLIFVYALTMNRVIDKKYGFNQDDEE
jgi:cation/acetate symporter